MSIFSPPTLPMQLQWKYSAEPELLGWSVRARNYNTFIANAIFAFMTILTCGVALFMYSVYEGMPQPWRTISCLFFVALLLFVIACMTHQKVNFACRITESGVEYCKWKDFPIKAIKTLKWFSLLTGLIFIILAFRDSTFLFGALVGPGGMGLTYLLMINSKNYQEMHSEYNHYAFKWNEITQLAIATNREVVDLKYCITLDGRDYKTKWNLNIFCEKNQKELVANIIKPYLSADVPFITAKVNVPMSTD